MSVSVCMASYNGQAFIEEQVVSILKQLKNNDELIIVDDNSSDNTREEILKIKDHRIFLYQNKINKGEVYSFSRSIGLATKELIFMADQDDIWKANRINLFSSNFNSNTMLITSNFDWIDNKKKILKVDYDGVLAINSRNYIKNIIDIFIGKTNYFGCAMAFKKDFVKIIYPIPNYVESHDLWIAKAANLMNSNLHLEKKTFLKRLHSSNKTSTKSQRSLRSKFYSRFIFIISTIHIITRIFNYKKKILLNCKKS